MNTTLAILAGGQGRRLGRANKAELKFATGEPLIDRMVRTLGPGMGAILIVGHKDGPIYREGTQWVCDKRSHQGPLAGLEAALGASPTDWLWLVACDMVHVSSAVLSALQEGLGDKRLAVPQVGETLVPTCALYQRALLGEVSASLESEERAMWKFVRRMDPAIVDFTTRAEELANINTHEDAAQHDIVIP